MIVLATSKALSMGRGCDCNGPVWVARNTWPCRYFQNSTPASPLTNSRLPTSSIHAHRHSGPRDVQLTFDYIYQQTLRSPLFIYFQGVTIRPACITYTYLPISYLCVRDEYIIWKSIHWWVFERSEIITHKLIYLNLLHLISKGLLRESKNCLKVNRKDHILWIYWIRSIKVD